MKNIMYLLSVVLIIMTLGCGSASTTNQKIESTKVLNLQGIASENNLSIGELNKVYRLDLKNRYSDGSYMMVNFQSVKADKQTIIIDNVLPLDKTKEVFNTAGFLAVYDGNGKQFSDLKVNISGTDSGGTRIIIASDKTDLTKCKWLSFGPVDKANSQQILFQIQ